MTSLDICFVLDCSSSMSRSIIKIQPQLHELIDRLRFETERKRNNCELRFGVVLFRDHDYKSKRLESHDFSEYDQDCHDAIKSIESIGGHDTPEDVLGGLQCAIDLSWKSEQRFIVFVGDAPCHGNKYHSLPDSFPDGCPLGLTPEGVLGEMRQKQIHFLFVKLSNDTDKMLEVFKPIYENDPNATKKGNEDKEEISPKKKMTMSILECRKQAIYTAKDLVLAEIIKNIPVPLTLLYTAAKVVRTVPNWMDYSEYIPVEMEEFVKDVLDDDVPRLSFPASVCDIHLECFAVDSTTTPPMHRSIPSSSISSILTPFSTKSVGVSL